MRKENKQLLHKSLNLFHTYIRAIKVDTHTHTNTRMYVSWCWGEREKRGEREKSRERGTELRDDNVTCLRYQLTGECCCVRIVARQAVQMSPVNETETSAAGEPQHTPGDR